MDLQYTVTAEDYADAFHLHRPEFAARWKSGVILASGLLTVGAILLVLSFVSVTGGDSPHEMRFWAGVSVSVGWVTLLGLLRERQLLQDLWRRLAAAHDRIDLRADHSGLHQRQRSYSGQAEWPYFISCRESPRLFLLYFNRGQYAIIPKRAFASIEDIESFRKLATAPA
jgi:hypothetical protein